MTSVEEQQYQVKITKYITAASILAILIMVPLFFPLQGLFCNNCYALHCASCQLGIMSAQFIIALFFIIMLIVSLRQRKELRKTPGRNHHILKENLIRTIKIFLIAVAVLAVAVVLLVF